jgi:hypothetical protein
MSRRSTRDRSARAYYSSATTGCLFPDRLMKVRLDYLLFVLGVGLLVIGVGISVAVIVVSTISPLLDLLG